VQRVWFSIFTPQKGDVLPEILSADERGRVVSELLVLRQRYPKLDMRAGMIERSAAPASWPEQCVFAQTTHTVSADLRTVIKPCQRVPGGWGTGSHPPQLRSRTIVT